MAGSKPDLYVFDAYGTLLDVHSAVARHASRIGPEASRLSEAWRSKQLEYTWVRTLARAPYRDFAALTEEALDFALARHVPADATVRDALLRAYRALEPFPDVAPALARLRDSGRSLAILSNGTPDMLDAALGSAGLATLFDAVISVDEVGRYKTAPEVYALVRGRFGVGPERVSFQSSNRWDIAGASLAGFRTVWVNRSAAPEEYPDCPAGRVIATLGKL